MVSKLLKTVATMNLFGFFAIKTINTINFQVIANRPWQWSFDYFQKRQYSRTWFYHENFVKLYFDRTYTSLDDRVDDEWSISKGLRKSVVLTKVEQYPYCGKETSGRLWKILFNFADDIENSVFVYYESSSSKTQVAQHSKVKISILTSISFLFTNQN